MRTLEDDSEPEDDCLKAYSSGPCASELKLIVSDCTCIPLRSTSSAADDTKSLIFAF